MKVMLVRAQEAEKQKQLSDKSEGSADKAEIRQLKSENKKLNVTNQDTLSRYFYFTALNDT